MEKITFSISKDVNGNKTVKIKAEPHKAFSIQTNGNLPETHHNGVCEATYKEVYSYISKYGTDNQKHIFSIQTHEYPLIWNEEEIDTGTSPQDARYLLKEYNLAFGGGVRIGRKRKI